LKKLLLVVFLLGFSLGFSVKVQAATGFLLEKASLDTVWSETYRVGKTVYQLNAGADWEWLKLGVTGNFDSSGTDGADPNLKVDANFPKLVDGLGIDLQSSWDARYQLLNTEVNYTQVFANNWQFDLKYESERKDGFTSESSLYSRGTQAGSVSLTVKFEPWKYQIKYLGQINDYLKKPDDFTQTDLQQEISWRPRKNSNFTFYYQEMARNFTVNYSSNTWEAKYGLQGDLKANELCRWNWDYYWLNQEKDKDTEERQSLKLELETRFDENNKLVSQFSSSDSITDYDEEYQATLAEDDPRADLAPAVPSWKIAVRLAHQFLHSSLEIGYFYSNEHDLEAKTFTLREGIFICQGWEFQKMTIALKASPTGDFQHQKQYYEIKISYEF
jgi:hypothetical protein